MNVEVRTLYIRAEKYKPIFTGRILCKLPFREVDVRWVTKRLQTWYSAICSFFFIFKFCYPGQIGGFLPGVKQIANVAALPGIVGRSVGLPDVHSGYGFAIGNMAAFDMEDPMAVVSPGGVGFDINCGVRLLRTNLMEKDVQPVKDQLAQSLFDHIPVGVGSKGIIPMGAR